MKQMKIEAISKFIAPLSVIICSVPFRCLSVGFSHERESHFWTILKTLILLDTLALERMHHLSNKCI